MNEPTHAGGVIESDGQYLIATSSSGNGWVLPKGAIDPGESAEQAAIREVREEAAVECEIVAPLGDFDVEKLGEIARTRFFLMRVVRPIRKTEDRELRWCDYATAKSLVNSDGARGALDRAEALRHHGR